MSGPSLSLFFCSILFDPAIVATPHVCVHTLGNYNFMCILFWFIIRFWILQSVQYCKAILWHVAWPTSTTGPNCGPLGFLFEYPWSMMNWDSWSHEAAMLKSGVMDVKRRNWEINAAAVRCWVWSIYLCSRKIADLQFKAANGGLAEYDGFFTTFHLKTGTETVCLFVWYVFKKPLCKNKQKRSTVLLCDSTGDLITSGNICLQEILRWCLWTYLFLGLLQKSDGFFRICSTEQIYVNRFMANVHILNTRCCFIPCIWRAT